MVEVFARKWGPVQDAAYHKFVDELRVLLEAYGKAALAHQSLPDSEHDHGAPV
jgi:hypothetical protein